jgi:hypothetical protein
MKKTMKTGKQLPLFTVVVADPEYTSLGYDWIEVLGFIPFRARPNMVHCSDPDCDGLCPVWDYESWAIVRTPHGIQRLPEEDLLSEIEEGIYVEPGTPKEEIERSNRLRRERAKFLEENDDECEEAH